MTTPVLSTPRTLGLSLLVFVVAACAGGEDAGSAPPSPASDPGAGAGLTELPKADDLDTDLPVLERLTPPAPEPEPQTGDEAASPEPFVCHAFRINDVVFLSGSWELIPEAAVQLREVVEASVAGSRIQVIGHADKRPSRIGNDELSLRRAEAVTALLASMVAAAGLDPSMIDAPQGRGDREPLVDGDSEDALRRNRRVEVQILCPAP